MQRIILHGSDHPIEYPSINKSKSTNDYGLGFYCTEDLAMAREWACKNNTNGYVNEYYIIEDGLNVLDLTDGTHNALEWIALLLKYRTFKITSTIGIEAKNYLIDNYLIDLSNYDIVIGYRADDSYFAYATAFINNSLSLESLEKTMKLGNLGIQYVLISNKAFNSLNFVHSWWVNKEDYYPKYENRDLEARLKYKDSIKSSSSLNETYILDIIRNGGK